MAGGPHSGCSCYWFKLLETAEQVVYRAESARLNGKTFLPELKRKAFGWTEDEAKAKVAKAFGVKPDRLERCDTPWRRKPGKVWEYDGKPLEVRRARRTI